jgi:hypothetical protein
MEPLSWELPNQGYVQFVKHLLSFVITVVIVESYLGILEPLSDRCTGKARLNPETSHLRTLSNFGVNYEPAC